VNVLELINESLRDPDPEERETALDRLGALAPPDALALAIPLLSDPVVGVRESAATCLGTLRDDQAAIHLMRVATGDPDASVRMYAVMSLSYYQSEDVRKCLLEVLGRDADANLARMKAAFQLWKYDDDEVMQKLKEAMLGDEDRNVRLYAADSLYLLFRARAYPVSLRGAWEAALADECIGVQRLAQKALAAQ